MMTFSPWIAFFSRYYFRTCFLINNVLLRAFSRKRCLTHRFLRADVVNTQSYGRGDGNNKSVGMTLSLLLCVFYFVSTANASTEDERLKALFLYNFANFVDWPDSAFKASDSDLRLCLFGEIAFGSMLDAVDGTLIGNHRLSLKRTKKLKDIETGCHMLFVSHEQRIRLPHFFTQIQYMYVLSVGDRKGFAEKGGVINIVRTEDQMQFDINLSTAMANGLSVSSDLLSLAREVKRLTPQHSNSSSQDLP